MATHAGAQEAAAVDEAGEQGIRAQYAGLERRSSFWDVQIGLNGF